MQLNKDEIISDNTFYELVQKGQGNLYRQGTVDEYAIIQTIKAEDVLN